MKFSKFAAVLALATLSTFAYSQSNDKVYTIRFSHVQSPTALKGIGAEKFKELAEKYGGGRIKVEVYHDGKLVNDRLSAAALIKNNVDMVAPSTSQMELFYGPDGTADEDANPWAVFDLPFLFPDLEKNIASLKKSGMIEELGKTMKANSLVLDLWNVGYRGLSTNIKIDTFKDLEQLKPRIPFSKVIKAQYLSWNVFPRVTDYGALYTLNQYDLVNSSDNPPANFYSGNLYKLQRYYYKTGYSYVGYAVIVRKNFWEELPADLKASVRKAMDETSTFVNESAARENNYALEQVEATGLTRILELPAPVVAQMKKSLPQIESVLSDSQRQAYSKIKATISK